MLYYDVVRYRARPPAADHWSDKLLRRTVIGRAVTKAKELGKPWRLQDYGGDTGPELTEARELRRRLRARLKETPRTGGRVGIETPKGTIWIQKALVRIKAVDTAGNDKVDRYFSDLVRAFAGESWGTVACRNVGQTSTPSQHRNWVALLAWKLHNFLSPEASAGANAVDWHGPRKTMDAAWKWALENVDRYDIEHLIYWPSWSKGPLAYTRGYGVRPYSVPAGGSDHSDHIHTDFTPRREGADRC